MGREGRELLWDGHSDEKEEGEGVDGAKLGLGGESQPGAWQS